jgi:hypothetical protein
VRWVSKAQRTLSVATSDRNDQEVNMINEYTIPGVSTQDIFVALECEAERAEGEGFTGVAERQRALALHLQNAEHAMQQLDRPVGHRLQMNITFTFVPVVNPVLRKEFRRDG